MKSKGKGYSRLTNSATEKTRKLLEKSVFGWMNGWMVVHMYFVILERKSYGSVTTKGY